MKTTAEMFDEAAEIAERVTRAMAAVKGDGVLDSNRPHLDAVFEMVVSSLLEERRLEQTQTTQSTHWPVATTNKMPMDELERLKIIGEYRNEVQRDIRLAFTFHQRRFSEPDELVALQEAILAVF